MSDGDVALVRIPLVMFTPIGQLASTNEQVDDACRASCVDWYGTARPILTRGRVFALLG